MDKSSSLFLIITQTNTLVSRMIKLYTRAPYNHVSIALDANLDRMYSFARKKPPRAFPSGFMQETMTNSLFSMLDYVPCAIYRLPVTQEQYSAVEDMISSFNNEYKFNVLGFAPMLIHKEYRRKKHFMCSQFVAFLLTKSGAASFDKDYSLVTPEDIRTLPNSSLVFSGNLKDYVLTEHTQTYHTA